MTTIDIEFMTNMNKGQVPPGVRVRIGVPQDSHEDLMVPQHSPRMGRSSQRKATGRPIEGKSPAHKMGYDSMFTITAHLPNDMGTEGENKRCKLHCYPGMTVQQVIESEIPNISHRPYLVYQFPSRALLNPEKEASVLQDQEIWIEPARTFDPDIGDERLGVVKELYSTEDAYLEHLRNIFDVYMEPLRTWGMPQSEMNTLFLSLSRLCDLLMNFFSELELAVKSWNTNTTLIGGIFTQYRSFWDMYIEYAQSYTVAMRLLKQKRTIETFNKFLDIKRGAAMHTLESLMLLPVQRVSDYHRYLNQLLNLTSRDHIDYQNIRHSVARAEEIIQARADELVCLQNESKLDQVQLQFPNDALYLTEPLHVIEASLSRRSKSIGQAPIISTKPYSSNNNMTKYKSSVSCFPISGTDSVDSGNRKNLRMYLQEGPVKLLVMTKQGIFQSQERYLFLFSDLLLMAKIAHRTRTHHRCYRLKNRLRLSEMWVDELTSDMQIPQSKSSFILGWPLTNCIAIFSTEAEKVLWFSLISKNVRMQRQLHPSDSISIHVLNMVKNNPGVVLPEFMQVHVSDKASDILRKCIECFDLKEPEESYQLWVKIASDKEEPLNGYECPFAIQTYHNRVQLDLSGDSRPQQLDFVLKRKVSLSSGHTSKSLLKRIRIKRNASKAVLGRDSKPDNVKMFGVPLDELIINNQLPEKLQEILIRLWVDGPNCLGIFRQSASLKKIREMKEVVDGKEPMDLSDVSIHVVGALLKELLRNVPGGVLTSARYTEFVATNDIKSAEERVAQIRRVLSKLPLANQVFLRYLLPLLYHISQHETINQMTTTNLSICFAPSLLEPDYSLAVIKNEAPNLVEFMICHAMDIYNNELPELFRQFMGEISESERDVKLIPVKDEEDTELSEDGYYHRRKHHRRDTSLDMGTSASEDSLDEDDIMHGNRRPLTMMHTSSDSTVQSGPIGRVLLGNRGEELIETDLTDTEREEDEEEDHISPSFSWRSRHKSGDSMGRRRSVSAQTAAAAVHEIQMGAYVSPPSPSRSRGYSSSSGVHGHSPMFPHRIDHDSDGSGRSGHRSEPNSSTRQKKKRKPGYSNSFSKPSDLKHNEAKLPQSSSASFYDPVERPRSRSVLNSNKLHHNLSDEVLDMMDRNLARSSNQSISSRGSGSSTSTSSQTQSRGTQTQPQPSSTTSLLSNRSGSSSTGSQVQVDPVTSKVDRDSVKQIISNRFGIKSVEGGYEPPIAPANRLKKEDLEPKPEVREGSIPYNPYSKYESGYNSSLKRQSVASSIDDRPEAEQHLPMGGSLGRRGEVVPLGLAMSSVDNESRLTIISGGYNSDTESAPSRTLNRPDKKLQEVSGPNSPSSMLPNRYSKTDASHPLDIPSESYRESYLSDRMSSMNDDPRPLNNQSLISKTTKSDALLQKPALAVSKSSGTDRKHLDYSSSDERNIVTTVTLGPKKASEKSRSMPGYTKNRTPSASTVKTVKVIRYELPAPKKIRRINLRAYNTKK